MGAPDINTKTRIHDVDGYFLCMNKVNTTFVKPPPPLLEHIPKSWKIPEQVAIILGISRIILGACDGDIYDVDLYSYIMKARAAQCHGQHSLPTPEIRKTALFGGYPPKLNQSEYLLRT